MVRINRSETRYACNCIVSSDSGWIPRDSEENGNIRDLDSNKLKTAINREGGPLYSDESKRIFDKLKEIHSKGKRKSDLDKMKTTKEKIFDDITKQIMDTWTATPGLCELHDSPVILSSTYDYEQPEIQEEII